MLVRYRGTIGHYRTLSDCRGVHMYRAIESIDVVDYRGYRGVSGVSGVSKGCVLSAMNAQDCTCHVLAVAMNAQDCTCHGCSHACHGPCILPHP